MRLSAARGSVVKSGPLSRLPVWVRVVHGVAAGQGLVVAIAAAGARREMFRRFHLQLVAAVIAFVCAGGDVAASRNGISHDEIIAEQLVSRLTDGGRSVKTRLQQTDHSQASTLVAGAALALSPVDGWAHQGLQGRQAVLMVVVATWNIANLYRPGTMYGRQPTRSSWRNGSGWL